jgi:hypothetical protein
MAAVQVSTVSVIESFLYIAGWLSGREGGSSIVYRRLRIGARTYV